MPKSIAAVLDEHVEFFERAVIEQELDALTRGELAASVLGLDALDPAAEAGFGTALLEPFDHVFHGRCPGWITMPADRSDPSKRIVICSTK